MSVWTPNPHYTLYDCSVCRRHSIDDLDTPKHQVVTGHTIADVCRDCIQVCNLCGDFLDQTTHAMFGPKVNVRDWAADGQLQACHAHCAASEMLGHWSEDEMFSIDCATQDEIDHAVACFGGMAVAA